MNEHTVILKFGYHPEDRPHFERLRDALTMRLLEALEDNIGSDRKHGCTLEWHDTHTGVRAHLG